MIPEPKLKGLYQEVILDHNRRPRNFKEIEDPTAYSHGKNPLCGDDYHLYINVSAAGVIEEIGFYGQGCAISKSSASIMTTLIKGKKIEDAESIKDSFLDFMTKEEVVTSVRSSIDRMVIFEGVKAFPIRVKCATLIWHALQDVLKDAKKSSE